MGQPPQPGQGAWPPQGQPYYPQQQYPQQPQYPQQYPPPRPPRPPLPPEKPKWPWILAIGLVLALVVAAGVVVLLASRSKPKTDAGAGSTASRELKNIPRKGYGEQGDGVADPAALVEKENATPVRHAGAAVIPACTLLSLTDLARNGLLVLPNPLALPYSRTYFDNQGTGPVERGSDLFVPIRPSNSCSYGLAPKNSVSMDVFQESYINPAAMVYSFKRYRPAQSVDGVKVTKSTSSDGTITSYTLRLGGTLVDLHTSLPRRARPRSSRSSPETCGSGPRSPRATRH